MSLEEFRRKYPAQTMTLGNGKPFTYRYYRNPKAAATAVLLTGGIGLSDLFYRHFEWHSRGQRFDPAYLHHENRQKTA